LSYLSSGRQQHQGKSAFPHPQLKLSLYEDVWGSGAIAPAFSTSVVDEDEWSASRLDRFIPREIVAGTHWIEGWVGLRVGLGIWRKEKSFSSQESNPERPAGVPPL
jgi:hypothetical protein